MRRPIPIYASTDIYKHIANMNKLKTTEEEKRILEKLKKEHPRATYLEGRLFYHEDDILEFIVLQRKEWEEGLANNINKFLPERYEIVSLIKDELRETYQKRFNKDLDYDEWVGVNDHVEECARKIDTRIRERTELNYLALQEDKVDPIIKHHADSMVCINCGKRKNICKGECEDKDHD